MENDDMEFACVVAENAARSEVERFMLCALKIALSGYGKRPRMRQALVLGLRAQAAHWRAERLTLGPLEMASGASDAPVQAAFRDTFAASMQRVHDLLDEFEPGK